MTLAEIRSRIYDRLSYTTAPPTDVVRRLDGYINDTQRELITMRGLGRLRRSELTFSSVAGSPFCVLPQAAVRLHSLQDTVARRDLKEITVPDLRAMDPARSQLTDTPYGYSIINLASAVAKQPSDASTLYIKSDSASDVATAYIEGVTSGNYPFRTSGVMTGTTAVAFTGSWVQVTKLFLSAVAVGNVTLHEDSGAGTELSRITPGVQAAVYSRLHLYGTPSEARTLMADVDLRIFDLSYEGAVSPIPEDFHYLLVIGALKKEALKRKQTEDYNIAQSDWKTAVGALKAWCRQETGNSTPSDMQYSQLGPWYPAGS